MTIPQMAIVGIGETTYSSKSGMEVHELILQAATRAIKDAGLKLHDIDGIIIPREYAEMRPYELEFYTGIHARYTAFSCMETTAGVINAPDGTGCYRYRHGKIFPYLHWSQSGYRC